MFKAYARGSSVTGLEVFQIELKHNITLFSFNPFIVIYADNCNIASIQV